jgi:hypothetical protein
MTRDLDVLTLLLLDPCLTTGEAAREAAALAHLASPVVDSHDTAEPRGRKPRPRTPHPADDGPAVGF